MAIRICVNDIQNGGAVCHKRALHIPRHMPPQKKDPKRPHGYISGFNFFAREHRPVLLEEQPELKFQPASTNLVNKLLGNLWKNMTKDQRAIYEQKAVIDKCRYLQEMKTYNPTQGFIKLPPRINPPSGYNWDGSCKDAHVELPLMTAYGIFVHQERQHLARVSKISSATTTHALDLRWEMMCNEERALYDELASL